MARRLLLSITRKDLDLTTLTTYGRISTIDDESFYKDRFRGSGSQCATGHSTKESCPRILAKKVKVSVSAEMPKSLPESTIAEDLVGPVGPSVEYYCNSCSADCSHKLYHCPKEVGRLVDLEPKVGLLHLFYLPLIQMFLIRSKSGLRSGYKGTS